MKIRRLGPKYNVQLLTIFICLVFLVILNWRLYSVCHNNFTHEHYAEDLKKSYIYDSSSSNQYLKIKEAKTPYPKRVNMGECKPVFGKITVLVLINEHNMHTHYKVAQDSVQCYLKSVNYTFRKVNLDTDERVNDMCRIHQDVFFRKHCAVLAYLNESDWTYVLDGDTGVVNPNHCLEEWIDDRVNIIFYERFWSFEIMAGNYIIRNSEFSRTFLRRWAEWEFLPFPGDKLADNGVLHIHVLQTVLPDAEAEIKACDTIYRRVKFVDFTSYFAYVACVKGQLGANHVWPGKIRIYRKAHGWARDAMLTGDTWGEEDFMFHSWKEQHISDKWRSPFYKEFDISQCGSGYNGWNWRSENRKTVQDIKNSLSNYEFALQMGFNSSARVLPWLDAPNIGECYPNCDMDT